MDFLKNVTGGGQGQNTAAGAEGQQAQGGQGGGGGFMDKISGGLNNAAGGGQAGEAKEDYLDKGVDFVQQRMGGGDQSNETAVEQQKDEMISDQIRSQYRNVTGSDFPIADK